MQELYTSLGGCVHFGPGRRRHRRTGIEEASGGRPGGGGEVGGTGAGVEEARGGCAQVPQGILRALEVLLQLLTAPLEAAALFIHVRHALPALHERLF